MQITLLKSLVGETAGAGSEVIIDILLNKKDVNEFLIAKKMNLTINQVRNILYKLSAEGFVKFSRKKDKKKGWYIYLWTLNIEKCLERIELEISKKIENLKGLLNSREVGRYYVCKGCNIEVNEETALEHDFSCEECAEVYTLVDNTNALRDLKGKITKKEKDLEEIKNELTMLREKKEKERLKKPKESPKKKSKKGKVVKKKIKKSSKKKAKKKR